jgi:hypothetical protein
MNSINKNCGNPLGKGKGKRKLSLGLTMYHAIKLSILNSSPYHEDVLGE